LKEFDVLVENKPGELARICELLGGNGVNIKAIASERSHNEPLVRIVTDDEKTTQSSLQRKGISFETKDVLSVRLTDKPGELGRMARKLARAGVNVDSIFILSKEDGFTDMALTVDNMKKAKEALR
jgi:hypothetical protein